MSVTLSAAGAHGRKRGWPGVSRKVMSRPLSLDAVGADVLGDAAGLRRGDGGVADAVEEGGLAVVDVAHNNHYRRGVRVGIVVLAVVNNPLPQWSQPPLFPPWRGTHGDQAGRVKINDIVDAGKHAEAHQLFNDLRRRSLPEAARELATVIPWHLDSELLLLALLRNTAQAFGWSPGGRCAACRGIGAALRQLLLLHHVFHLDLFRGQAVSISLYFSSPTLTERCPPRGPFAAPGIAPARRAGLRVWAVPWAAGAGRRCWFCCACWPCCALGPRAHGG